MKSSMVTEKMNPSHFRLRAKCVYLWGRLNDLNLRSEATGYAYKKDRKHLEGLLEAAESAYFESCGRNGYEEDLYKH